MLDLTPHICGGTVSKGYEITANTTAACLDLDAGIGGERRQQRVAKGNIQRSTFLHTTEKLCKHMTFNCRKTAEVGHFNRDRFFTKRREEIVKNGPANR